MANLNRECKVCGVKYSYCPSCSADLKKPKWMKMFDCEECKNIFDIDTRFNIGIITKEEAQTQLAGINIDKIFTEQIKKDLSNIFYVEPVIEDPIIEPVVNFEELAEVSIEEPVRKSKNPKKYEPVEQEEI